MSGAFRAKASASAEAEALPAEKDVQLGALQDCNAQMLQVRHIVEHELHHVAPVCMLEPDFLSIIPSPMVC